MSFRMNPIRASRQRGFRAIAATVAAAITVALVAVAPAMADELPAYLQITKQIDSTTVQPLVPGGTVNYRVEVSCSNVNESTGCADAALVDVVPSPLVLNTASVAVAGSTVVNTTSGNTVRLAFTQSLLGGGVGLDDGGSVVITYSATLPLTVSADADGIPLINDAEFTATNAYNSPTTAAATITPVIPSVLAARVTKTVTPESAATVPGTAVELRLTAGNASNQSVQSLTVQDVAASSAANPFEYLEITGISTLTPPTGADRVQLQWLDGTTSTWSAIGAPVEIPADLSTLLPSTPALADIVGVRVVFSRDGGLIPTTPTDADGVIVLQTALRDTVASLPSGTVVENTAGALVTTDDAVSDEVTAGDAIVLQAAQLGPVVTKSFAASTLVPGDGTTTSIEVRNGDFPVERLDLVEPAPGSPDLAAQGLRFDGFDDAALEWPVGATAATFQYQYADADPSSSVALVAGDAFPTPEAGRTVVGFQVSFTGVMPASAYAAVEFGVTALAVVGTDDVTSTNVVRGEVQRGTVVGEAFGDDDLTRTPARVNTTVEKVITPTTVWDVAGAGSLLQFIAKVNDRTDTPSSTVGAQSLIVQDPADPAAAPSEFWDRFDLRGIAPTAIPANALLTVQYWDGSGWVDLAVDVPGPVSNWSITLSDEQRAAAQGVRFVFTPRIAGQLLPPGFTVSPYLQVGLRSTLRSDSAEPVIPADSTDPVRFENTVRSTVANEFADPVTATDDDLADILVRPTSGGVVDLGDKQWVDPVGEPPVVQARTGADATARILWGTDGIPFDAVTVTDPAPATTAAADAPPAVAGTAYDAFDLVAISPITTATDPLIRFDAVDAVEYYSDALDAWVDITAEACPTTADCDGAFPGYTLTDAESLDALAIRLRFVESPDRASRITSPLDPAVGSGVASSTADRPIELQFRLRDDRRSDPDQAVTGRNVFNAGTGLVENTVRITGWVDDAPEFSTTAGDEIRIVDVPLNVSVTKDWDQTALGLPPAGTAADRYPLATATIVATNETAARVDHLELTDPDPDGSANAFEFVNLYQIVGVTVPDGADAAASLVRLDLAGGGTAEYTIADALALTPSQLASVVGISVLHEGRIDAGASTTLQYVVQLRAEQRTSGDPVAEGDIVDNTVRTWVRDPGGVTDVGFATGIASDDIEIVQPTYGVTAYKTITPTNRVQESAERGVTVAIAGEPSGTVRTTSITLTDATATFWNAYRFTGFSPITLQAPIDRVRVEALVGVDYTVIDPVAPSTTSTIEVTCAGSTDLSACWQPVGEWTGTPGGTVTPTLPGSIDAADIRGLRYTVDRADGANWERPYNPRQVIEFTADRADDLVTGGPVPSTQPTVPVTAPAPGETVLGRTTDTVDVLAEGSWARDTTSPPVYWSAEDDETAVTNLTHQANAVQIVKTPTGAVSPGTRIPFVLTVTNTGTWAQTGIEIVDRIETDGTGPRLVVPTLNIGDDPIYTVALTNGSGQAQTAPSITPVVSADGSQIDFPLPFGFVLPAGWTLTITANLQLRSDIAAGESVANDVEVTNDRVYDRCVGADDGTLRSPIVDVETCAATTTVVALAASPLTIVKGVVGDGAGLAGVDSSDPNYDDLGVLAYTGAPSTAYCETPNAPDGYWRSPCVPITRAGGTEHWRSFMTNAGNIPSTRLAMIDVLPASGDRGVIIDQARSSHWRPVFTGGLSVDVLRGGNADAVSAQVTVLYLTTVATTACNRLDIMQGVLGRAVTAADLQTGEPVSCVAEVNSGRDWQVYDEASMSAAELASVRMLKVVVAYDDGNAATTEGLQPGETLTLSYSSTTAAYPDRAESSDRDSIAWNSIAGGALGFDPNTGTSYASQVREARKTGVAMATGKLDLSKLVVTPTGFTATTPTTYTFEVQCTSNGESVPLVGIPVGSAAPPSLSTVTLAADGTVLHYNDGASPTTSVWSNVNLPLYAECSITETPTQGAEVSYDPVGTVTALRDFATRTDVADAAPASALTPDGILSIQATNEYHLAGFRISKTVDAAGAVDQDGTAIERPGPYRFTAVCTFLGQTVLDTTITVAAGSSQEVTDLPAGANCTVTELNTNGAGLASTTVETTVGGTTTSSSGKAVTFELAKNVGDDETTIDNVIDVTNTFGIGTIRIDKTVAGAGGTDWGNEQFQVRLRCTLASASPTVVYDALHTLSKSSPTVTVTNIANGATCAVTETQTGGATSSTVSPTSVVVDNTPATAQVVTVTNTFRVGTVAVQKVLAGEPAAGLSPATDDVYGFAIACTRTVNGDTVAVTPIPGGETRTVIGAGTATWTGLPAGASCVVTETDAGFASATTLSPTGGAVTVGSGTTVTVTATNEFANGSVTVAKTVSGAGSDFAPDEFEATVECTWQGAAVPLPDDGRITLVDGGTATVASVPVGSICTVVEDDAGQRLPVTPSPASVTVTDGVTPTITLGLENVYELASLRVSKEVVSSASPVPSGFAFSVSCTFLGASVLSTTFTLDDGEERVFSDLPARADCEIVETDARDADGTIVDGSSADGTVTLDQDTRTVTIAGLAPDGDAPDVVQNEASFENLYGVAGLVVTKELAGGAADLGVGGTFPVHVVCTFSGETILDEVVDLIGGTDPSASWTGLVAGATCEITETVPSTTDAVVITPNDGDDVTVGRVTIAADTVASVTVENWYLTGSLEVTKRFGGDAAEHFGTRTYPVQLVCTLHGDPIALPDDGILELSAASPVGEYTGLPTGSACRITELDTGGATSTSIVRTDDPDVVLAAPATDGYAFTVVTDTGTLTDADQPQTPVSVLNVFDFASVSVFKEVDDGGAVDAAGDPVEYGPFQVTIACTLDGEAVAPLEDATRTIAAGEVLEWTELPVGADCIVTESDTADAAEVIVASTQAGVETEPTASSSIELAPLASLEAGNAVTFENRYEVGSVTVRKVVDGTEPSRGARTFTVAIDCVLIDASHPAPGLAVRSATGEIGGADALELLVENLPAGTACTVSETDAGSADRVAIAIDGEETDGRTATLVLPAGAASASTVVVRNTFDVLASTGTALPIGGILIAGLVAVWGAAMIVIARPPRRGRHAR